MREFPFFRQLDTRSDGSSGDGIDQAELTLMMSPTKDATNILSSFMSSFSKMSWKISLLSIFESVTDQHEIEKRHNDRLICNLKTLIATNRIYVITDLETTTRAIFDDDAYVGWIGARADKRIQIVVP